MAPDLKIRRCAHPKTGKDQRKTAAMTAFTAITLFFYAAVVVASATCIHVDLNSSSSEAYARISSETGDKNSDEQYCKPLHEQRISISAVSNYPTTGISLFSFPILPGVFSKQQRPIDEYRPPGAVISVSRTPLDVILRI